MHSGRASLKDVSQAVGVSIRTVSRVLKGEDYVEARTRQRVQAAARKVGYHPNRIARSLRMGRNQEITVVTWSIDELYVARIASLEERLRTQQYSVSVLFGGLDQAASAVPRLIEELRARNPAAVAVTGAGQFDLGALARGLAEAGMPLVVLDRDVSGVDRLLIDRRQGVYDAIHYLAGQGRRRIAYLGPCEDPTRLDGYRRALVELGRPEILMPLGSAAGSQFEMGRAAAAGFANRKQRPDAIQAYADEVALGFMAGLYQQGVRVPDDVALIGFDDRRAAALSAPPLTTVAQPSQQLGALAADLLLQRLNGTPMPAGGVCQALPTQLMVREST